MIDIEAVCSVFLILEILLVASSAADWSVNITTVSTFESAVCWKFGESTGPRLSLYQVINYVLIWSVL